MFPERVIKGKKLPGHMGSNQITVKNLEVIKVEPDENILIVRGAVPGSAKDVIKIYEAK